MPAAQRKTASGETSTDARATPSPWKGKAPDRGKARLSGGKEEDDEELPLPLAFDEGRRPYTPSSKVAFQILLIARIISAAVSIIPDCDETYNYWEPLHQLLYPPLPGTSQLGSFKTWEYDPRFAIRSWAYLVQFAPIKWYISLMGYQKIHLFFTARSVLAIISAYCESCLYVSARAVVGPNAARYLFVALLGNAGIFEASTALIPSSYTFYTTTLAWSFALRVIPSDSSEAWKRCLSATAAFALGAIIGWPFAIVLSFPFVLEELFIAGQRTTYSFAEGFRRLFAAALVSGIAIGLPTMLIDTLAYGRTTLAPWNIITYNILSKARGAGPELYGTEPSSYFLRVMFLSFNLLLPLALLSGPAVAVSWLCDNRRGGARKVSSLLTRLSPFYIWLGLLTSQSHKEERFLYPAYALICFNAAVCLAQLQNVAVWLSRKTLPSSFAHQAKRTISVGVWLIIGLSALLGALRSAALTQNYSAPMWVAQPFWTSEGRTILESRNITQNASSLSEVEVAKTLASMHDPVKVCFAGEWYRFSSSFFLPQGVQPEFTWSSYEHILPGHFPAEESAVDRKRADPFAARVVSLFDWVWPCKGSRVMEPDYNEFNQPEPSHLSHPLECDYVIDLHLHHRESKQEETSPPSPTSGVSFFAYPHIWEKVECLPFLDWESSQAEPGASAVRKVEAAVSKALWLPKGIGSTRAWSDFCLLRLNTKCQAVQELKEQGKAADLSKLQNISW